MRDEYSSYYPKFDRGILTLLIFHENFFYVADEARSLPIKSMSYA
jgi:hypothetical protein